MADILKERIRSFLEAHHVMTLATSNGGAPHAVSLFFACDDLAVVWVSDPGTRHSHEVSVNNKVSATIASDFTDYAEIRGLQIAGTARKLTDPTDRSRCLALLTDRYPFLRRISAAPGILQNSFMRACVYRLEPSQIILIDNSVEFGHKEILDLECNGMEEASSSCLGNSC